MKMPLWFTNYFSSICVNDDVTLKHNLNKWFVLSIYIKNEIKYAEIRCFDKFGTFHQRVVHFDQLTKVN